MAFIAQVLDFSTIQKNFLIFKHLFSSNVQMCSLKTIPIRTEENTYCNFIEVFTISFSADKFATQIHLWINLNLSFSLAKSVEIVKN